MKKGMGARPLLEKEILRAQANSFSGQECAKLLGVTYNTYKKYAKMYGIFDKSNYKKNGTHFRKLSTWVKGRTPLKEILEGKHPSYDPNRLFMRLIRNKVKAEMCEVCGFHEKRISDENVPLKLAYIDGDRSNHKWANLQVLCFNCYYLHVGKFVYKEETLY